ncbi:hypothetical protein EDEG_01407 [Edhazardia aedis USNM 41457]|uniref:Uncharacterized protein n=1 Tax=Edhazardia aedis (strain USNM 41457) TaxID=1003232 RepID=J9D9Y9_EDHAE|nr:hypothetical protein EDEG_01407 [Edhazardia aedis USNM 41457]|eukprot:EJW04329.1 hypothetical protein EDEG_01407 [Edhazardia aedis USNM 41457]
MKKCRYNKSKKHIFSLRVMTCETHISYIFQPLFYIPFLNEECIMVWSVVKKYLNNMRHINIFYAFFLLVYYISRQNKMIFLISMIIKIALHTNKCLIINYSEYYIFLNNFKSRYILIPRNLLVFISFNIISSF